MTITTTPPRMNVVVRLATLSIAVLLLATGCQRAEHGEVDLPWTTDLPKALATAKAERKLVLIDFTGSDWCPPCKALHQNVLTAPDFAAFASNNLVLVEADFPRGKKQSDQLRNANSELKDKFGVSGLPTIVLLDPEGKELLKQTGYGGETAGEFVAKLQKFRK